MRMQCSETSHSFLLGEQNDVITLEIGLTGSHKVNVYLPNYENTISRFLSKRNENICILKGLGASLVVAPNWKQSKYPSPREWMNK